MDKRLCFYDIETSYIPAYVWRTGKQVVTDSQLVLKPKYGNIISIAYKFENEKKVHVLDWGVNKQDSTKMLKEFDKIVSDPSVIPVGHNGQAFDTKKINTMRMLNNLTPLPDWSDFSEDTLKLSRKHFSFASHKLNHIADVLGLGKKDSMCFQDWIDIVEHKCPVAMKKMIKYNIKDVLLLEAVFNRFKPYVKLRNNYGANLNGEHRCTNCGSANIIKNGTRLANHVLQQRFYCNDHGGFAGYGRVKQDGQIGLLK